MNSYNVAPGSYVTHTARITLMEDCYKGYVSIEIGGNCRGASILESAIDFFDDPSSFTSNCNFVCIFDDDDKPWFSFVLSDGNGNEAAYVDVELRELMNMMVAVEIIEYQENFK